MDEERTFREAEEELLEAVEGLRRTDEMTRELRMRMPDRKDEAALE